MTAPTRRPVLRLRYPVALKPVPAPPSQQGAITDPRKVLAFLAKRFPKAFRIDLEGNAVEPVNDHAIQYAVEIEAAHRKRRANDEPMPKEGAGDGKS